MGKRDAESDESKEEEVDDDEDYYENGFVKPIEGAECRDYEIMKDIDEYFQVAKVKREMWVCTFGAFFVNLFGTFYNYKGMSSKGIMRFDFTMVITHIYVSTFMMGVAVTYVGHFSSRSRKSASQQVPFLLPAVLEQDWFQFIPKGSGQLMALMMGFLWSAVAGTGVVILVVVLWAMLGMDQREDKMNGYLYAFYSSVMIGVFGHWMIIVGMLQGSTNIPKNVMEAFEKQTGGGNETDWVAVFTDKSKGGLTMAQSPAEVFEAFGNNHWRRFWLTVVFTAGACTMLTYGWLSDGEGRLLQVIGRDQMVVDMAGSSAFCAALVTVGCTFFQKYVEMGFLPYLVPELFTWGLYRLVPHKFPEPRKLLKRTVTNAFWWSGTATTFCVACSYLGGFTIHYSGYSYIMMKIAYYLPLCAVVSVMNIIQICDCDESEYNELMEVIEAEQRRQDEALNGTGENDNFHAPPRGEDVDLELDDVYSNKTDEVSSSGR